MLDVVPAAAAPAAVALASASTAAVAPAIAPVIAPTHGRTTPQSAETVAPAGWDPSHITFSDVLSALNPLQYVPVVGTIYREVTGDVGNPSLRIAVSAALSVFLGPMGLANAMIGEAANEVWHNRGSLPSQLSADASDAYRRAARVA